jgi:hypothetical protein
MLPGGRGGFSTTSILSLPNPTAVGPLKKVERVETGVVFEQAVEIRDRGCAGTAIAAAAD